jgi:hypothetical protein
MKPLFSFGKKEIHKNSLYYLKILGVIALIGCLFFYVMLIVEYTSEK